MPQTLSMPATLATRKGAGYVAEQAQDRTVVLTHHGKKTAVVMSPERYDEMVRDLREASNRLIAGTADLVAQRSSFHGVDEARRLLHAQG